MTFSSKGLISINSKEEILQRRREADYKECLINEKYHIYSPVQIQILDNEFEFSKERFQNLFSLNNLYHGYYVSEVFMLFAE